MISRLKLRLRIWSLRQIRTSAINELLTAHTLLEELKERKSVATKTILRTTEAMKELERVGQ